MNQQIKVLCVCNDDLILGPMTAIVLGKCLKDADLPHIKVESAGVRYGTANLRFNEKAAECLMVETFALGEMARDHVSRYVGDLNIREYNYVIVPDEAIKNALLLKCPTLDPADIFVIKGDLVDPFGLGEKGYRDCLESIINALPSMVGFVTFQ